MGSQGTGPSIERNMRWSHMSAHRRWHPGMSKASKRHKLPRLAGKIIQMIPNVKMTTGWGAILQLSRDWWWIGESWWVMVSPQHWNCEVGWPRYSDSNHTNHSRGTTWNKVSDMMHATVKIHDTRSGAVVANTLRRNTHKTAGLLEHQTSFLGNARNCEKTRLFDHLGTESHGKLFYNYVDSALWQKYS